MPMPQRNSRRVVQLLSNNSLLSGSGTGASGISTVAGSGLSNCIHSGGSSSTSNNNNNAITATSSSTTTNAASVASNGRVYGNPMAAAAASASALNTISASAHHPQPPPLITDTLTACLDVNGTYICTSYSPRCYIIQKVTPNTVTVTPHLIGGEGGTTTGVVTGTGSNVQGVGASLVPILPSSSANSSAPTGRKFGKAGGGGGGGASASSANTSSPSLHFQQANQSSYSSRPHRHFPHHNQPQHHHHHHHGSHHQNPHRYGHTSHQHRSSTKNSPYVDRIVTSLPSTSTYQTGRAYMNGDVGSTNTAFTGEESQPAMVLQSSNSAGAGTQISESRVLNGLKDGPGMSREQMKSVESKEIETADNSRRNDPGGGANSASTDIPKEDLRRLLLQQLEYYFSPENLANDKFLVSQMDSDHYVYISTLANFNMVKKLTGDIDLVTDVLRDSKNVQVHSDGKRVRPVSHRTVVILRGIPESTPVDEIKALFNSENCPKCNSCEFAFNDSWYVSFESDEDAQRAHRYLREDVKEFKGQPIMARIKSRPTTLLAQGAGVHLKNGFHQPGQGMGPYIPPSFVPGSQTGPTTAVAPTPMYAHGQTMPSVFPMQPNYNYAPWQGFLGMSPEFSQMYNPMNGLPPQHPPSSTYQKSMPINARPRNPNQVRPRRPLPPSSDNQGMNGVVGASGATSTVAAHQSYGNPSRKNNSAPPPLLNIVQNPPSLPLVNPTSHNHSQSHLPHSSVQVGGNAISQNGSRHYNNSLPSSHSLDYHPSGSMRPYRGGGVNDSRPRSSLSNRKGPPRREEEASYEPGPSASPSMSTKVPSTRGAPPIAPVPQPPAETSGPVLSQGNINLDLEGSQFPPLPGSGQTSGKNGDAIFEGRLSDVVKGVKNMKSTSSTEKEDTRPSAVNLSTEIIVSAEEENYCEVREVSAASPIKDLEVEKKIEHSSSQTAAPIGKKEFREVGVGSVDDTHDIRSSHYKSSVVSGARCKETADKSTRTDEALLNGVECQGMKPGSTSTSALSQDFSQNGGNRKSASSQSSTSKSPVPSKRAVPGLQVQTSSTSVSVGPEVPYSSRNVTSPVTNPAKPTTSQTAVGGIAVSSTTGNSLLGRGANSYMAKQSTDNNNARANGMVFTNSGNSSDRDAFPSPGFVKSVPTCKPFPNSNDQISKEVSRSDADRDRKESGQGDGKKSDDCSNEEREGPIRLSYAQVAQQRKDTAAGGSSNNSSALTPTVVNCVSSASNSTSAVPCSSSTSAEDKKKLSGKDTKDARFPSKNQRGGGGDRDRSFRRGFRNRMMSDHSDGGSGTSEPNRRLPKPSRSPK